MIRLGLVFAALLLGSCQPRDTNGDTDGETASPAPVADGKWRIVAIDGESIADDDLWIATEGGAFVGGHDGCNHWGYMDGPEGRMIHSELEGCPKTAAMEAYTEMVATPPSQVRLAVEGEQLTLSTPASRFTARRMDEAD